MIVNIKTKFKIKKNGFTLVEMIAGIVIMAMAMTAMTTTLFPQASGSVDPIYQVRAAELGQSLLNEIMGKAFDENTDLGSGTRCGESGTVCTADLTAIDAGEITADTYDDVDDYNGYDSDKALLDNTNAFKDLYANFTFSVSVIYDGNYDGIADVNTVAKRVDITVTTPSNQVFRFAGYKGNF